MRFAQILAPAALFLLASACNPDPVDPEADFTIRGSVKDVLGSAPSGVKVHIYKVDSVWSTDDNFLQYTDLEDAIDPNAVHVVTTDTTGGFELVLKGAQVNTEGGGGAAYLVAVFYEGGDVLSMMATASDWHFFRNEDPVWDVGSLALWDNVSASQNVGDITFSWSVPGAVAGIPSFLFAWDYATTELLPTWAGHSFGTSLAVPRAAFANTTNSPEFFVTTFSKPAGDSRNYQHRSGYHAGSMAGWTSTSGAADLALVGKLFEGSASTPFGNNAAVDDIMDTTYDFVTQASEFFIDITGPLDDPQTFDYLLLYNLGVRYYGDSVITVDTCDEQTITDLCWTRLGDPIEGNWNFQNWVYLAAEGPVTAHWIRVSVDRQGTDGAYPYFDFVSEIRVVDAL